MLSFSSETPFCQTDSGPALNPEFPLIPLFKFPGPLLPKPQESAWLTQESEAINRLGQSEAALSRRVQLGTSPEFQHEKLHSALAAIQDALACAGNPSNSLSREMMCWSVGSFHLTDRAMFNDSILILLKAGRLPPDLEKRAILGPESLGFGYFYDLWGRGIQEYIVIPHLKGQAK